MHLATFARVPLALIVAVTMLMTLASVVAAAPSSGPGGSKAALADHIDPAACDLFVPAGTGAEVLAALEAQDGLVLDAAVVATLTLLADAELDACVDLTDLTLALDVCVTDLELLAQLVTDTEFDAIFADLLVDVDALDLAAVEADLEVDLDPLTDAQLVQLLLDEGYLDARCLELTLALGDMIGSVGIVCVEVTAIDAETGIDFEVVFGADLVDDALLEAFAALLGDLDLEVGDTVCVALIPVGGDIIIGDVLVVIEGDVTYGDVNIGDIVIGDCSNAVVTIIVNGVEVVADVQLINNGDQCVTVVEERPTPAAPSGQGPDDDGQMMPDTATPDPWVGAALAAVLALLMLGSLGGLAATAARKRMNG